MEKSKIEYRDLYCSTTVKHSKFEIERKDLIIPMLGK
jgi:hypothetical protein